MIQESVESVIQEITEKLSYRRHVEGRDTAHDDRMTAADWAVVIVRLASLVGATKDPSLQKLTLTKAAAVILAALLALERNGKFPAWKLDFEKPQAQ